MGEPALKDRAVPHLHAVEPVNDTASASPELGQPRAVFTETGKKMGVAASASEDAGTPEPEPDDSHEPTQPLPLQTADSEPDPSDNQMTRSGRKRV